jgi:acyl-lipid omega-6 desaturase (Delta-12 desaturase)
MTPSDAFVPLPIGHADIKLALKKSKSPLLTPVALDARDLTQILARYRAPSCRRSIVELVITAGPLILLWLLIWATLDLGYWLCLLLAVPAAGFLVRLFMIQHDCGHGAFFHRRFANDWVGRVIGVLTLTPYDFWRRAHAVHHATSGNLERRGIGDVDTLTVHEYLARCRWGRLRYRVYRHPVIMFGLAPAYLFIVQHRLLVHLPIMLLAASAGVWLFYVQHQFENTVWAHDQAWNLQEVALHGSSHYALPSLLRWFTANIGIHHIHHLCSRIPYYRLPLVLRDYPDLDGIGRLTLLQSFGCVRLALWDEGQKRLVSFREVRRNYTSGDLEQCPLSAISALAERAVAALVPKGVSNRGPF